MADPLFENVLSLWRSTYEVYTALKSKLQENQRVGLWEKQYDKLQNKSETRWFHFEGIQNDSICATLEEIGEEIYPLSR